jgi:hypothetical protein
MDIGTGKAGRKIGAWRMRAGIGAAALIGALLPTGAKAQDAGLAAVVDPKFGEIFLFAQTRNGVDKFKMNFTGVLWPLWERIYGDTTAQHLWDKHIVSVPWMDANPAAFRINTLFELKQEQGNPPRPVSHLFVNEHNLETTSAFNYLVGSFIQQNREHNSQVQKPFYPRTGYSFGPGRTFSVWGTDQPMYTALRPYIPNNLPTVKASRALVHSPATRTHLDFGPVPGAASEILMGAEGAANWDFAGTTSDVDLVVMAKSDRGTGKFSIWCLTQRGNQGYQWSSLGSPFSQSAGVPFRTRAPLAVPYIWNGEARIRVFVVALEEAFTQGARRWKLYSIERRPNGEWFDDQGRANRWNDHGLCPDLPLRPPGGGETPRDGEGVTEGFSLSSRIVWTDNGGASRVNLFGATDNGKFLVEFFFNGATWQWGLTPQPAPPNHSIRAVGGGVAIFRRPDFRLATFVRMQDDSIWEFKYHTQLSGNWIWQRIYQ